MPTRQSTRRHEAEAVQGDGAWVTMRRLTFAEGNQFRAARRKVNDLPEGDARDTAEAALYVAIYADLVIGWNWVDDDGAPLPQPSEDPTVIGRLTDQELEFLADLAFGSAERLGKSDSN